MVEPEKKSIKCFLFPDVALLHFKNMIQDKILANGRPYRYDLMVRSGGYPSVMLSWFVCPTIFMVTTNRPSGPEYSENMFYHYNYMMLGIYYTSEEHLL